MTVGISVLRNYFLVSCSIFIFILISFSVKLNLFSEDLNDDGFYSQIISLTDSESVISGLAYMHYARFISVFPFFQIWIYELPNYYNAILLSVFLWPIISFKANTKDFNFAQTLIVLLPFFFSIRVTLGACGYAYLFIFLFGKDRSIFFLIVSLLFSMLSSGNLLCCFLILFFYRKQFISKNPLLFKALAMILFVGIVLALQNKYIGISEGAAGYSESGRSYSGISGVWGLMANGTLIVSLQNGQYTRAIAYALLYVIGIILVILIRINPRVKEKYFGFFAPMLLIFWFEGMGFISYQYCFIFFALNHIRISYLNLLKPAH